MRIEKEICVSNQIDVPAVEVFERLERTAVEHFGLGERVKLERTAEYRVDLKATIYRVVATGYTDLK